MSDELTRKKASHDTKLMKEYHEQWLERQVKNILHHEKCNAYKMTAKETEINRQVNMLNQIGFTLGDSKGSQGNSPQTKKDLGGRSGTYRRRQ